MLSNLPISTSFTPCPRASTTAFFSHWQLPHPLAPSHDESEANVEPLPHRGSFSCTTQITSSTTNNTANPSAKGSTPSSANCIEHQELNQQYLYHNLIKFATTYWTFWFSILYKPTLPSMHAYCFYCGKPLQCANVQSISNVASIWPRFGQCEGVSPCNQWHMP